jgi:hypothetical protein
VLQPAGNIVDPSAKIGRTREAVVGMQHELIANLAVGVDFIYRKYDRGTTTYVIGYEPGGPNFPLSAIYTPATYTDPVTGLSASYYAVCATCTRPSGIGNITLTNPNYQIYKGVDLSATKRFSNRWQMATSLTIQDNPNYFPFPQTATYVDPTGYEYNQGISTVAKYLYKAQGSYQFPWDITVSGNFNLNQGATRTLSINGPGNVFGGVGQTTLTKNTLTSAAIDQVRFDAVKLLDMGVTKAFVFRGGRNRLKLTLDGFNLFNDNTILSFSSNNQSVVGFTQPSSIVPPRVFRVGTAITF